MLLLGDSDSDWTVMWGLNSLYLYLSYFTTKCDGCKQCMLSWKKDIEPLLALTDTSQISYCISAKNVSSWWYEKW